jgi:hypothetical protein
MAMDQTNRSIRQSCHLSATAFATFKEFEERYSLPIFFDRIGQVHGVVQLPVQLVEGAIVFGEGSGHIVADVGTNARLRIPPIIAAAPWHHCQG